MTFLSFRSKLGCYYTDAYMAILIIEAFFPAQLQISGEESYYVLKNKQCLFKGCLVWTTLFQPAVINYP